MQDITGNLINVSTVQSLVRAIFQILQRSIIEINVSLATRDAKPI